MGVTSYRVRAQLPDLEEFWVGQFLWLWRNPKSYRKEKLSFNGASFNPLTWTVILQRCISAKNTWKRGRIWPTPKSSEVNWGQNPSKLILNTRSPFGSSLPFVGQSSYTQTFRKPDAEHTPQHNPSKVKADIEVLPTPSFQGQYISTNGQSFIHPEPVDCPSKALVHELAQSRERTLKFVKSLEFMKKQI